MMMLFDTFQELDRLSDAIFSTFAGHRWHTPVDLRREKDRYILEADLPGIDPKSIEVSVDGQWLTIRAERSVETASEDSQWLVRERTQQSTVRQFALGQGVDVDGISANYEGGVLRVEVPLAEHARPRKIEVALGPAREQRAIGAGAAQTAAEESSEGKAQPAHSVAS